MRKNICGVLITIISIVNILFMIYCYFAYNMGTNNNIYILVGTIISIAILILLFRNNIYAYVGIIFFYGLQMFGTKLIVNNFRYGLILRTESGLRINSSKYILDFNFTAILLVVLGILGFFVFKRMTVLKEEKQAN